MDGYLPVLYRLKERHPDWKLIAVLMSRDLARQAAEQPFLFGQLEQVADVLIQPHFSSHVLAPRRGVKALWARVTGWLRHGTLLDYLKTQPIRLVLRDHAGDDRFLHRLNRIHRPRWVVYPHGTGLYIEPSSTPIRGFRRTAADLVLVGHEPELACFRQMIGERPGRVFGAFGHPRYDRWWIDRLVGALSLDNLAGFKPSTREELETRFDLDLTRPPLLVTFHPVTREPEQTEAQIQELLGALADCDSPVIFTLPNADTHGTRVREHIQRFCQAHPSARLVESFGQHAYFSMMTHALAMVGNSSSGIIEAASFGLPVVNVGARQQGRLRSANVIDVPPIRKEITQAVGRASSSAFKAQLKRLENLHGDGQTAGRIIELLLKTPLDERLLAKRFHDLDVPPAIP